ncbi:uncharacterized protein B0H18DRAFT_1015989 [Fomitopsis serialis]|uniref:uncharacterized protein n=1 Tax=Fomitopsis serialis TaxID=139415 RepID=UPI0020074437|nr:uncharacterized protein B0H18DRAFT_1015989 [Neoantrodia serialis]KAH9923069.1 hypothetical protein B0H18DRAFT_1015989 [Neoantrodia serialis]
MPPSHRIPRCTPLLITQNGRLVECNIIFSATVQLCRSANRPDRFQEHDPGTAMLIVELPEPVMFAILLTYIDGATGETIFMESLITERLNIVIKEQDKSIYWKATIPALRCYHVVLEDKLDFWDAVGCLQRCKSDVQRSRAAALGQMKALEQLLPVLNVPLGEVLPRDEGKPLRSPVLETCFLFVFGCVWRILEALTHVYNTLHCGWQ